MARAIVDQTGTAPATLVPGEAGKTIRVLGFGLTSAGAGLAILKSGATVLHRIALPGGEVRFPGKEWEIAGEVGEPLTMETDADGVQVVGDIVYLITT